MLARMYARWCERRGFTSALLHESPGETTGYREVTILVRGTDAAEWLAAETGVHRLVRVSPFADPPRVAPALAVVEVTADPGGDVAAALREGDLDYELPKQRAGA